jgi:hypothetical protein
MSEDSLDHVRSTLWITLGWLIPCLVWIQPVLRRMFALCFGHCVTPRPSRHSHAGRWWWECVRGGAWSKTFDPPDFYIDPWEFLLEKIGKPKWTLIDVLNMNRKVLLLDDPSPEVIFCCKKTHPRSPTSHGWFRLSEITHGWWVATSNIFGCTRLVGSLNMFQVVCS